MSATRTLECQVMPAPPPALGPPQEYALSATRDGTRQLYLELLPSAPRADGTHPVLIALHGHGADRWQFATDPRDECRAARDAAAVAGMIYVSPDYRAPTSWMGPAAEADVRQLLADLRQRHGAGPVVLVGGSMGGTAALIFTALHPTLIAGTVCFNGTANMLEFNGFPDAIAAAYGATRAALPDEYRRRSAELHAAAFTAPLACTTGGQDTVVPPDSVLRLVARLAATNPAVLLLHRPAGGHATDYADSRQALAYVLERALIPLPRPSP